jgi:enterochelin esterase-like enzyme
MIIHYGDVLRHANKIQPMKHIFLVALLGCCYLVSISQVPKVSSGTIKHYEKFESKYVISRNVDVWLPHGYDSKKKYAVMYMHDGQMLFDSTNNWNKQEWGVDECVGKLMKEKRIIECIVVGIWNVPADRFANYFPEKVLAQIQEPAKTQILTKQLKEEPSADNYLKFLVTELKPFIDSVYSTKRGIKNTFVMGSSMGALISVYALCEYPNVFGGAACLSIHSPLAAPDLINEQTDEEVASKLRKYLLAHLPKANTRKIYFDYGDHTLDSLYKPFQIKIDDVMHQKGYTTSYWQTKYFPGEDHSEKSWRKRLDIPLLFLLKK